MQEIQTESPTRWSILSTVWNVLQFAGITVVTALFILVAGFIVIAGFQSRFTGPCPWFLDPVPYALVPLSLVAGLVAAAAAAGKTGPLSTKRRIACVCLFVIGTTVAFQHDVIA